MLQGPLVSSLGETVAVSTCTPDSMVRAEISRRSVNASRCHTALQHIDDSTGDLQRVLRALILDSNY